jgi:hypothetical protein
MYDELIQRLRADEIPLDELARIMHEAADAIERLSNAGSAYGRGWTLGYDAGREENKPRWIPVTEALPECDLGAEVGNIEWISCGMVHAGCFGRGGKYRDAYFRTWTDAGEGMDANDAEYWRAVTLPEPTKEE